MLLFRFEAEPETSLGQGEKWTQVPENFEMVLTMISEVPLLDTGPPTLPLTHPVGGGCIYGKKSTQNTQIIIQISK